MIDVKAITDLHKTTVSRWHEFDIDNPYEDFLLLVCRQHQQNFRLWHQEDIARSSDARNDQLAQVKRNIDKLNQQRNDLIEQLDDYLIRDLCSDAIVPLPAARLNTETPGSVIDRLSILALRIYHMQEQAARADASPAHRAKACNRLEILYEQHADLSCSLAELLDDIACGRKRLKVYRQFKMYNDPSMNPVLYRAAKRSAA